ncbi:hypothetical protein MASR1M36_05370 [Candidatus Cloacimonadaceae bacterium]
MAREFRISSQNQSRYPYERFEMILRKLGFTNEDFESLTLPELYLRLCLADPKAYSGDV